MKRIIILFCIFLLASCISTPHISELRTIKEPSFFTINKTVYDTVEKGAFNIKTVEGLKKGTYVAIGEDAEGTFYYGENCYLFLQGKQNESYLNGGVWVPQKTSKRKAYLYYINPDYSNLGLGVIPSIIAKSEVDNIMPVLTPLNEKSASKIDIMIGIPSDKEKQKCASKIEDELLKNWK